MDQDKALRIRLVETFNDRAYLKKLGFTRKDIRRVFGAADWKSMLSPLLPIRERLTCAQALDAFRPVLDTLAPEPVQPNNPIINLPEELRNRVALSPHIGGITSGTFYRSYRNAIENIEKALRGERPDHVVNHL